MTEMIANLDYQVFQWLNDFAGRDTFLNEVMRFFAERAEYIMIAGIILYWFTRTRDNRMMAIQSLIATAVGFGTSALIAHFFYRDRPFVDHVVYQLVPHAANASFPSDHATAAFAIAMTFYIVRKREGNVWLVFAALIAISRVWTGVHYPIDILAGACLGMVTAWVVHRVCQNWTFANRVLQACIEMYERVECKILPKKQTREM
ncbi:undecaprenyl-diphosphatase [Paenibacillus guangzhouensis]|uniref:undecaprenyl-diphosphatase n=1 Tax=Paenibacillus guangzhouensis TaxID=1473112 RepID=UPI001D1157F5|nr:undecaprenyl-diphosphatase [Paenibacillus guangzhouensis]